MHYVTKIFNLHIQNPSYTEMIKIIPKGGIFVLTMITDLYVGCSFGFCDKVSRSQRSPGWPSNATCHGFPSVGTTVMIHDAHIRSTKLGEFLREGLPVSEDLRVEPDVHTPGVK